MNKTCVFFSPLAPSTECWGVCVRGQHPFHRRAAGCLLPLWTRSKCACWTSLWMSYPCHFRSNAQRRPLSDGARSADWLVAAPQHLHSRFPNWIEIWFVMYAAMGTMSGSGFLSRLKPILNPRRIPGHLTRVVVGWLAFPLKPVSNCFFDQWERTVWRLRWRACEGDVSQISRWVQRFRMINGREMGRSGRVKALNPSFASV